MMDDPSRAPLQAVTILIQDILCKIMVYFIVKLECVLVVIYQIQGIQRRRHILAFQTADRVTDMAQIALGSLVGEQDLIVPVQPDEIILTFAE